LLESSSEDYLKRLALINDSDGYVNIREKPDRSSAIVGKIIKNKIFLYTPDCFNDWWLIYTLDGSEKLGYVHNSRILKYPDFPLQLKVEMKKRYNRQK
jgi:hypothetical protein